MASCATKSPVLLTYSGVLNISKTYQNERTLGKNCWKINSMTHLILYLLQQIKRTPGFFYCRNSQARLTIRDTGVLNLWSPYFWTQYVTRSRRDKNLITPVVWKMNYMCWRIYSTTSLGSLSSGAWRIVCVWGPRQGYELTHKQLETHGCVISNVATDGLVLKHQAISIHSTDKVLNVLDQSHEKNNYFDTNINYIYWKKRPRCFRVNRYVMPTLPLKPAECQTFLPGGFISTILWDILEWGIM